MSTSLNIKMKDALGKELSQAITYVDNKSTNSDLKGFAQGIVSLTNNTLTGINKITKTDIDGNFYAPIITVSSESTVTSFQPTKVDDNNYTFNASTFLSNATDAAGMFKFQYFSFSTKANNTDITDSIQPYVITNRPTPLGASLIFVSCKINSLNSGSTAVENYQIMILTSVSSADDLKKDSFQIVIPAGSQGALQWDSNTINFTFV